MSKKRGASGGSYTGGTGDVKPQTMTLAGAIAGAADDYRVDIFNIPVQRPSTTSPESAVIMEILELHWYLAVEQLQTDQGFAAFGYLHPNSNRSSGDTSTLASFRDDIQDPRTFGAAILNCNIATSGAIAFYEPHVVNMCDENGNGYLYAGDSINLVQGAIANATPISCTCKIIYRWVKVGLIEYLGIVSTQSS